MNLCFVVELIPAVNRSCWVAHSRFSVALGSLTASTLHCVVLIREEGVWTHLGNHQSILSNCNQSRSGPSWRLPSWYGDSKSECLRSSVSWGSVRVCVCVWESHGCRSPFLHSALIPHMGDPTPLDLNTSQHPSCESQFDLNSPHHDPRPPPPPTPKMQHPVCVRAPKGERQAGE